MLVFDVSLVKAHLSRVPVPVEYIALDSLTDWLRSPEDPRRVGRLASPIDPARVPDSDPGFPLVFLDIGPRRYLIDGHHRLEHARQQRKAELPSVTVRCPEIARAAIAELSPPVVYWWTWSSLRRFFVGRRAPAG